VGFLLVVEDHIAIGSIVLLASAAATWLTGLWVVPWGIDAYSRKLSHIMRDLLTDLRGEESRESLRRCIERAQRLKPPPVWEVDHKRLLDAMNEYLVAIQRYHGIAENDDRNAVRAATEVVSEAHARFDTIAQELSTKMVSGWTQATSVPSAHES
jgi:hypothetical protein